MANMMNMIVICLNYNLNKFMVNIARMYFKVEPRIFEKLLLQKIPQIYSTLLENKSYSFDS